MLDADQPNRNELAQSRTQGGREQQTAVAMDPVMSAVRKQRMCLRVEDDKKDFLQTQRHENENLYIYNITYSV